jgi:thiol-disulfide isomerase/thioredoxin
MNETTARTDESPRRSQLITWIGVLVIVAGGMVLIKMLTGSVEPRDGTHRAIGRRLMALDATPLVGADKPLTLDDLKGKVTLVNFWMRNCPYCLQELPHLAEIHRSRADRKDFKLLSLISGGPLPSDLKPLRDYVEAQLRSRKIEMPVYADPQGTSQQALAIAADWDGGMPATVILDRQGIIRGVWNGYVSGDEKGMAKLVDKLLEE